MNCDSQLLTVFLRGIGCSLVLGFALFGFAAVPGAGGLENEAQAELASPLIDAVAMGPKAQNRLLVDRDGLWWLVDLESKAMHRVGSFQLRTHAVLWWPQTEGWLATDRTGATLWVSIHGDSLDLGACEDAVDRWYGLDSAGQPLGSSRWGRCLVRLETKAETLITRRARALRESPQVSDEKSQHNIAAVWTSLELPFCPGAGVIAAQQLWIADAFGGRWACVSLDLSRVVATWSTPAHQIGGVALSSDQRWLWITQQESSETLAKVARDAGLPTVSPMIDQLVRVDLQQAQVDITTAWREATVFDLSQAGAAADPGDLASDGERLWIALRGVDAVEIRNASSGEWLGRIALPGQPKTLIVDATQGCWVVLKNVPQLSKWDASLANVSQFEWATRPATYREQGESLFESARLTRDGQMSCNSCHVAGHTNGQLADTTGDDSWGTPKLVPTLLGTADSDPWGWLGNRKELADQVRRSVIETQQGEITPLELRALVGYLFALPAPGASRDARREFESDEEWNASETLGKQLFQSHCATCHIAPLTYTAHALFDVGTRDEAGIAQFNPPSLRGVGQRDRFLHDGSVRSLKELLGEADHPGGVELTEADIDALVRWVEQL